MSQIEPLEARRLFVVAPTAGDDVIEVQSVGDSLNFYRIVVNGVASEVLSLEGARTIRVEGLGGDDLITIDTILRAYARVSGGDGDDTIVGGSQADSLFGDAGNDLILGKNGSDSLIGGEGNDTLRGGGGNDVLRGDESGASEETVDSPGDDMLFGEAQGDTLHGSGGDDLLNGGDGGDVLRGEEGDDAMYGAEGGDAFIFSRTESPPFWLRESGNDTMDGGASLDTLDFVGGSGPLYLSLDGVANDGNENDTANVTGFEYLTAGIGSMGIASGSIIDASGSPVGVRLTYPLARNRLYTVWIGSEFDDLIDLTTFGPVRIEGRGGNDTITSGEGSDVLLGGAGDDKLAGGFGDDMILGEAGNDSIDGSYGNDRIAGGVGNDVIHGDLFGMTFSWGSDMIEGNAGHDFLMGGGNNDVILGQGGRDTIIGGGSDDRMYGGPGVDRILGGPGMDSAEASDQDLFDSVEVLLN